MITGLFGLKSLDLLIVRIRILMMRFLGLCMGKVYDVFMFYVFKIFLLLLLFFCNVWNILLLGYLIRIELVL
jgi:hypothetical protein